MGGRNGGRVEGGRLKTGANEEGMWRGRGVEGAASR